MASDLIEIKEEPLPSTDEIKTEATSSTIQQLILHPFLHRSKEEQLEIITRGRPRPELPRLKTKKDHYTRHFHVSQYAKNRWLTGCEVTNKLYCWPCLLFGDGLGHWACDGYKNLNNLQASQKKHRMSVGHLKATVKLLQVEEECLVKKEESVESQWVLKLSKRNEEIFKRFIDVIITLIERKLKIENNYKELIIFLKSYDVILQEHTSGLTAKFFQTTENNIQTGLIKAIKLIMEERILLEIKDINYICLIIFLNTTKVFFLLQYVKNDVVFRRCVCVCNEDLVESNLEKIIENYNLEKKLSGIIFDGNVTSKPFLQELQLKLQAKKKLIVYGRSYLKNFINFGLTYNEHLQKFLKSLKQLLNFIDCSYESKIPNLLLWLTTNTTNVEKQLKTIKNNHKTNLIVKTKAEIFYDFFTSNTQELIAYKEIFECLKPLYENFPSKNNKINEIITKISNADNSLKNYTANNFSKELLEKIISVTKSIRENLRNFSKTFDEYKFLDLFHNDVLHQPHEDLLFPIELMERETFKKQYTSLQTINFANEKIFAWLAKRGLTEAFESVYSMSVKVETLGDGFCVEELGVDWGEVVVGMLGDGWVGCEEEDLVVYFNGVLLEKMKGEDGFYEGLMGKLRVVLPGKGL